MRDDDLSRVVFLNEFEGNIGRDEVRAAMAERFNPGARALGGGSRIVETARARRRSPRIGARVSVAGTESNVVVLMKAESLNWPSESICMQPAALDVSSIAADMYRRTCRVSFDAPGFCVLNAGQDIDSVAFRRLMVDLKREMATIHEESTGRTLAYLSAARFDQQETTRPHLDGGPDECFLMLGYEPSAIESEIEIADYAKCAFDLGLSPKEFMAEYNPMFRSGYDILRPYSTRLACFSRTDYQIVCINNSCSPWSDSQPAWQGTLHTATIPAPDESERRIIDSTMIASVPAGTRDTVDADELNDFITTSAVRRSGYGNTQLEDDT